MPLVYFYNMPELRWLIPVAGFDAVIDGARSLSVFVQNKKMALGKLTVLVEWKRNHSGVSSVPLPHLFNHE